MNCSTCGGPKPETYRSHRCPACTREYQRQWRARNRNRRKEQRRSETEDRQRDNNRLRRWRETNPERDKELDHKRRALKKGCEVSAADIQVVVERSGGVCGLCNCFVPDGFRHIDHIIPLSKGGPHSQENLQLLCYRCNTRKGAKLPEDVEPETWGTSPQDQPFLLNPHWK